MISLDVFIYLRQGNMDSLKRFLLILSDMSKVALYRKRASRK